MCDKAFQDYWDHNDCWGCGANNAQGLRIKSRWLGDESVSNWRPGEHHKAGPDGFLNGGIIATLIDCHCVATAIADAYRQEGRELDTEPLIWYVTASIKVDYHKPVTITRTVTLRAKVHKREGRKSEVGCELFSGGVMCARAQVLAVRVPPEKWYG